MNIWQMALIMAVASLISFGNAGTIAAVLQRSLVQDARVLSPDQLLYAYALARITPGQVNLFTAAIGYMLFGLPGATVAVVATMAGSYLVVPLMRGYRRLRGAPRMQGLTRGVTSTAVGALLATSWNLGSGSLDVPVAWLVFAIGLALLLFTRLPIVVTLLLATAIGLVVALTVPGAL